jgi:hypothetical protein
MRYLMDGLVSRVFYFFTSAGITFGSGLAIVISYAAWHSIPWAILHGIFSWAYVIYFAIRYN